MVRFGKDSLVFSLWHRVAQAFGAPLPNPPIVRQEQHEAPERRIVRILSTGNVRLQRGQYMTRKDIEDLRDHTLT